MRHYDAYGRRVPSSRYDSRPSDAGTALLLVLVFAFVAICGYLAWRATAGFTERAVRHDEPKSLAVTRTGVATIRWYVMTDPETGVQYLVNDRGGCVPREGVGGDEGL